MKKYFEVVKNINFVYHTENHVFKCKTYTEKTMNLQVGDIISKDIVNFCLEASLWPRNVNPNDFKEVEIPMGWGVIPHIDYTKKCTLVAKQIPKINLVLEKPDINTTKIWVSPEIAGLINSGDYPDWFIRKNYMVSVPEWMEKWAIQLEWEKEEEKRNQAAREAFLARSNRN